MKTQHLIACALSMAAFCATTPATAQNYQVIVDDVDSRGHGVTVLRVWGTHEEMGYALGVALAEDAVESTDQFRDFFGDYYGMGRIVAGSLNWPAQGLEQEMDAFVEGVLSVEPDADLDGTDMRVFNSMSDLIYALCRSHSTWGRYVEPPVLTLSTRRLDYSALVDAMHHHVVVAMEPDEGVQWVNVGFGGFLAVVTAVNEFGTVAALHDLGSADIALTAPVARSAAARAILTGVHGLAPEDHLDWAADHIGDMQVMTDTFIPYYVPEGHGGMFTCTNQVCRLLQPQADFLFGEAIMTTNSVTDGHSVPEGAEWLEDYYDLGGPKDLESHWDISGPSFHRLSVEYRGRGDMTLWFDGEIPGGVTERVELEWDELFDASQPDGDGDGDSDGDSDGDGDGDGDGDSDGDGDGDGDSDGDSDGDGDGEEGCSCATPDARIVDLRDLLRVIRP